MRQVRSGSTIDGCFAFHQCLILAQESGLRRNHVYPAAFIAVAGIALDATQTGGCGTGHPAFDSELLDCNASDACDTLLMDLTYPVGDCRCESVRRRRDDG